MRKVKYFNIYSFPWKQIGAGDSYASVYETLASSELNNKISLHLLVASRLLSKQYLFALSNVALSFLLFV